MGFIYESSTFRLFKAAMLSESAEVEKYERIILKKDLIFIGKTLLIADGSM